MRCQLGSACVNVVLLALTKNNCELVCMQLKMNARWDHGIQRGDRQSSITSVRTKQSSYTKLTNVSVLLPRTPPISKFGKLSQHIISTKIFPRRPDPISIQSYDGLLDSSSILSFVSHAVSSFRFGSGPGRTRYCKCKTSCNNVRMYQFLSTIYIGLTPYLSFAFIRPFFLCVERDKCMLCWRASSCIKKTCAIFEINQNKHTLLGMHSHHTFQGTNSPMPSGRCRHTICNLFLL